MEILEDVKKAVKKSCNASTAINTDLWNIMVRRSYISITVHFVDELFRLHMWTSFCSSFSDRHTGENIQEVVGMDVGDKLENPSSMLKWGVLDNASNMLKAINMSILELYTSLYHTQQLATNDSHKEYYGSVECNMTCTE